MDEFEFWLLDNWSLDPDGTPTLHRPPMFVKADGTFDVEWYDAWVEERRKDYKTMVKP